MKDITKKNNNIRNWIVALLLNAGVLALIITLTKLTYETNDDFVIASRIAGGYPYIGLLNYYLARFLIAIQGHVATLNVYVIFLIVISFISFVYYSKLILDKGEKIEYKLILLSVLIVFSFDHYSAIQFTKTAALVISTGFVVLADCIVEKKSPLHYVAAFAFIYIGSSIRYELYTVVLGIAIVSAVAWVLANANASEQKELFKQGGIAKILVIVILLGGVFGFLEISDIKNSETPELKYATEYNIYRTNIVDYPTYEYYDKNKTSYDEIGISENDLFLIDKWIFDYDGAASMDNLRKIDSIERPHDPIIKRAKKSVKKAGNYIWDGMIGLSSNGIHILTLIMLSIIALILLKRRNLLFILAMGATSLGLYIALYYTQRHNYRAFYAADIAVALWITYFLIHNLEKRESDDRAKISVTLGVIILIAAVASTVPLSANCKSKYERASRAIMSEEMESFFKTHNQEAYVWATREKKYARKYATPILAPDGSDDNVFNTGSWTVLTPFVTDKLAKYGMDNPIKDLVDNETAFFISNKMQSNMEEYYNKWYAKEGEKISLEQVDEIEGCIIWRIKTDREND